MVILHIPMWYSQLFIYIYSSHNNGVPYTWSPENITNKLDVAN